jgi:nucleoside-diphosphate-sugar epimerase
MRVLVTGCNGYIGCVLTPMLQARGHEVTGLDTNYYQKSLFTGHLPEIATISEDIRDVGLSDVEGFDAIIHLAGLSNDPLGDYRPQLTEQINAVAAVSLARLAKAAGVRRFLFASSCSNYGAAGNTFLDENAPFNPVTPYGVSKAAVEAELQRLADTHFSPTYLRASTAYGASPLLRFDLVINNLTAWAFTTGRIYLKSDGSAWRPVVHVEDIASAYIAALEAPREAVHDRAFNVGTSSENYRVRELAELVGKVVPDCRLEFAPDAGPDKRCYRVDCSRIALELHNFKPQWTARRGIEQLYDTYQRVGLTLADFEGARFMRIAQIKKLVQDGLLDEDLRWRETAVA